VAKFGICIHAGTQVVEFICYEGTFAAEGGPAGGMTCEDVGVAQDSATDMGTVQRVGSGAVHSDFSWALGNRSAGRKIKDKIKKVLGLRVCRVQGF
jgi:hypothetical protein